MTDHANLAAALVPALADLSVIEKGNTANIVTKDKGSYSYSYADIADVVKRTRPVLAEHGLVALTPVHEHGAGLACTVVLLHTSGERLDFGPFPFPHGRDAQATGSMVTYHRRYALVSALGMAAGDDDDGAGAAPRQEAPKAAQAPAVDYATPAQIKAIKEACKALTDEQRAELVDWPTVYGVTLVKDRAIAVTATQADDVLTSLKAAAVGQQEPLEAVADYAANGEPF